MDFVSSNYPIAADKFAFFEKADVNGKDEREVYSFLKSKCPNDDGSTDVNWNFEKFLVDRSGNPAGRFVTKTSPSEMPPSIEELINKN